MRKILIIVLFIVGLAVLWLWRGRDVSAVADRFKTIETSSLSISAISYEGNGTGGTLRAGDIGLTLDETLLSGQKPNVGTTKDGQLSLLTARCLGSCGLAPAVVFDGQVEGKISAEQMKARVRMIVNPAEATKPAEVAAPQLAGAGVSV